MTFQFFTFLIWLIHLYIFPNALSFSFYYFVFFCLKFLFFFAFIVVVHVTKSSELHLNVFSFLFSFRRFSYFFLFPVFFPLRTFVNFFVVILSCIIFWTENLHILYKILFKISKNLHDSFNWTNLYTGIIFI